MWIPSSDGVINYVLTSSDEIYKLLFLNDPDLLKMVVDQRYHFVIMGGQNKSVTDFDSNI
jgi:hypothetical protein